MTASEVREHLPLAYVLAIEAGVSLQGGTGICPLHQEDTPSFGVYTGKGGVERWKCFGCGRGGDVFDLLMALNEGWGFGQAADRARELLIELPEASWMSLRPEEPRDVDFLSSCRIAWQVAAQLDLRPLRKLIEAKGLSVTAEHLHGHWYVGAWGEDRVVMPHIGRDGACRGYKVRRVDGSDKPRAMSGSQLVAPYGVWRDTGVAETILIAEGESDTWTLEQAAGTGFAIWGLPTGAGSWREEWRQLIAGRRVVTVFDGDAAGEAAAARWAADRGAQTVRLPAGEDCTSLGAEKLAELLIHNLT